MSLLTDIRHYHPVDDLIASSGQPTPDQFETIATHGFTMVINLAMADSDHAFPWEGNLANDLGMAHVQIPVPFHAPEPCHLQAFLALMNLWSEDRVWVHCALNYRASAFLYLHARLNLRLDHPQAMAYRWPGWEPDPIWERFIRQALTCH